VTRLIVDMARSVKVDELSKAVSSAALQVGYKQLKHKQNEAVKEFVSGRDVFLSLPTGSSKSLCYAVLPAAVNVLFGKSLRQTVLFLAHCHGCLHVWTSHAQGHMQGHMQIT